jgi:lysine 2,3-aminomutase
MPEGARRLTMGPDDIVAAGLVEPGRFEEIRLVAAEYAVALTRDMAALVDPADPADPIAAQFVPTVAELITAPEERPDPIGDERWSPVPGIVHRYPDRVLLKPTLLCPVYCRFCFRREVVGKKGAMLDHASLERAFEYVRQRPQIWEVIVTGGDPLLLAPRRVADIVRTLDQVPHLGVIRFHTRIPVVDPGRVTSALVEALAAEKAVYVVIHANHPRELTPHAREAVLRLSRAGIPLLSQTVLLRGVNDDGGVLEALFRALVAMRVKPYYLHHADLARGTSHFRTGIAAGQRLVRSLRGRVSGLCQPTYVMDIPGGYGKVPIAPCAIAPGAIAPGAIAPGAVTPGAVTPSGSSDGWIVEDGAGVRHAYPPNPGDGEG